MAGNKLGLVMEIEGVEVVEGDGEERRGREEGGGGGARGRKWRWSNLRVREELRWRVRP